MPINQPAQPLDAGPRSVQAARRWAVESCERLSRTDLADCAAAGVSELVTNAILHGEPPIWIRMRGTAQHPRIEVGDASPVPPQLNPRLADDDELLATTGRGLGIVAMCSRAWGADRRDQGKVVWFEPGPAPDVAAAGPGDVYGFDASAALPAPRAGEGHEITLLGFPVALFRQYRRHFVELSRELRLLALAHGTEYPVAKRISDMFQRFEAEKQNSRLQEHLDAAATSDQARVDLAFRVSRDTPRVMAVIGDLLEVADQFCRSERLLSIAATPQQRQFQDWYLGEFVRQSRGEAPQPWRGADHQHDHDHSPSTA